MNLLLRIVALASVSFQFALALDNKWIAKVEGSNCNSTFPSSIERNTTDMMPLSVSTDCPPWYYISEDGNGCVAGKSVDNAVTINPTTMQASIKHFSCMTKDNNSNVTVLGGCMYSALNRGWDVIPLPCNVSELEDYMCAGLNREGQLCGRCKKGFAPAVYSYSLQCVQCKSHYLNWVKYAAVAFGPLTVVFLLVTLCHISPSSLYLHGLVLFSQTVTLPSHMRIIWLNNGTGLSFLDMWNLQFFRILYTPFCLYPHMTIMQSLALNYVIAFYPPFLLLLVYTTIKLYSRNCKPIVYLWKFIRPIVQLCKSYLNIETSLIQSFATVLFLSSMKIQSVSFDLLVPTTIYYNHGSPPTKIFLYLAGDIEYFGSKHLPYGILAICVLTTFVLFPILLLFLYPCAFFQRLLSKLHCNSLALKTFMDAYQGTYKDGTNNTRDYRYFSGVFFILRTTVIVILASMNSYYFYNLLCLIFIGVTVSIAIFHPQKSHISYTMDCLFTSALAAVGLLSIPQLQHPNETEIIPQRISVILLLIFLLFYVFYLVIILLVWKVKLPQRLLPWVQQKYRTQLNLNSEYALLT